MTALTVVSDHNNTEESTTSSTWADTAVSIAGSSLLDGVDYLVLYTASIGGSTVSAVPFARLQFGSTVIANVGGTGSSSGTPNHCRSICISGYYIITGNGLDSLQFQKARTVIGTGYIGGQSIIAIPLDDLVENTDYFQTTQNGDTAVITSTSTTGQNQDLISLVKTTEAADYLVLASGEILAGNAVGANAKIRLDIDGGNKKIDMLCNDNINQHYAGWSYAKIHTFTAASHNIAIEGQANGSGSAVRSWRRGRIILIKIASFDQLVSTSDNTVDTVGTNWTSTEVSNSHVYTANQTEDVVVIGNLMAARKQAFRYTLTFLRDNTSGLEWSKYIGVDHTLDDTTEVNSLTAIMHENINTSAKTYQFKRTDENNTTHNTVDEDDIIVWSMNTVGAPATRTLFQSIYPNTGTIIAIGIAIMSGLSALKVGLFG